MAGTKRSIDSSDKGPSKKTKFTTTKSPPGKPQASSNDVAADTEPQSKAKATYRPEVYKKPVKPDAYLGEATGSTSREAHAKQKQLTSERKAARPNADSIYRSKKIWERLRRKSHVPKDERDQLVKELFEIISGRVAEFVFKHDSVRVIQCAVKYATPVQKKQIVLELKGRYRELAESKYAKFLIAKMVTDDDEVRDAVVEEFYGHVKRLIRHPEASWIVDDIYRTIASKRQKAIMLREWYGPEFVVFAKAQGKDKNESEKVPGDLSEILAQNPEKRNPIMQHLKEMTNQLVQKKTTGFTILHDAMLQYFLNCKPNSPEVTEFLEMLRDDEEGDCYKNLAFTKSGSRLVCLALAYGSSKDRRTILKFFKTHIKLLASDLYGHQVLLTAYDTIDDTVMSGKAIFPELLNKDVESEAKEQELMAQTEHLTARIPLLYLMSPEAPKWLITDDTAAIIKEIREIRTETSKKDPETRRTELLKSISQPLLDLIASQAQVLIQSSFGCQFVTEVVLGGIGDAQPALASLAKIASDENEETVQALSTPAVGRMLKSLVQGGRFDKATKSIVKTEPPLNFHELLYEEINGRGDEEIVSWANGPNSFVVVAMLEAQEFAKQEELLTRLSEKKSALDSEVAGARIILEKLGGQGNHEKSKARKSDAEEQAPGKPSKKSKKRA
ncbi:hypothetical protein LTR84_013162 [Exophiala bonariae]|uniref:PUM-HD domain-containing protein n=1 Tax=Exophiala bonariae TaxID=1690606 RepID=A0AAV9NE03_9EURO|nr:hypothetical protein LTR84_013162 [Exophiala bonariae]